MYEVAINLLNVIYNNGYEAFIVGGFVRDKLLGINSSDIDITTNARPKDLKEIFSNIEVNEKYGSCIIYYNDYKFEVTTYRKDFLYENNRWPKVEYVNSIKEDVLRRDFTINSILIDKDKNYIDFLDGIKDLNNKLIKCIGNSDSKLKEDSLRILRSIRFMVVLDFNLDDNLLKSIKDNISLLDNLSYDRKKEELNHIFKSPNFNKYINMINELNIFKKLEIELKNDIIACDNVLGIWSQIEFSNKYNFSKKDMNIILEVKKIIKNKKIDNYTVYKYKKESIIIASQILNINVDNIINNLVIKNRNDIDIKYDDLKLMFNNDEINDVYIDLEKEILYNRLKNEKESIIKYLNCKRGD